MRSIRFSKIIHTPNDPEGCEHLFAVSINDVPYGIVGKGEFTGHVWMACERVQCVINPRAPLGACTSRWSVWMRFRIWWRALRLKREQWQWREFQHPHPVAEVVMKHNARLSTSQPT